jgi:hypothetical protein
MAAKSITRRKGGGAQVRASRICWTPANRKRFLARLAETLNVAAASRAVGLSDRGAYLLRRRDPGFAAAWEATIAEAYARVEMLLLERALGGTAEEAGEAGDTRHLESLSERALLTMLNQHRQTVRDLRVASEKAAERTAARSALDEEIDARDGLMAKLDEIAARLDAADRAASGAESLGGVADDRMCGDAG